MFVLEVARFCLRLMVPSRVNFLCAALAFVIVVSTPYTALAQWATNRATARNLAAEGHTALKMNDFATAEDRFRRADALVHAPTLVVDQARALAGLGLFVEAQERLELVLREGVADKAPKVWKRSLQDAHELVDQVRQKIGWLTISVTGPSEPLVMVDGSQVPVAALGVRRATNPGDRRIDASASGYVREEVIASIPEGGERAVTLELKTKPPSSSKPAVKPKLNLQPVLAREIHQQKHSSSNAIGYTALGLGSAGLVVGAITGAAFLGKRSDLAAKCPDASNCQQQGLIDEYNRYGTISGISLGFGLAVSAAGIWMLLSHESGEASPARTHLIAVVPSISIGHWGLRGRF